MLKVCDIQELIANVKKYDCVVCYGGGKRFLKFYQLFENTAVWDKVQYIVDNDTSQQKVTKTVGDKTLEIISLEELKRKRINNFAIIITPLLYQEIADELIADHFFNDIDFYCLTHTLVLMKKKEISMVNMPQNIRRCSEPLIPKVIHYCWFGGNPIPDKYKVWIESWHKCCPDYEIVQWNENNYDVTKNAYMYQAYQNKKWAFVPDYARLDIIYNHGGIYLDTDVELVQNIDDFLYQKGFAGFETNEYVALGLGFGAIKGLPIIKEMMEAYDALEFINEDGSLNLIASPHWQTETLKKHGLCMNGEYQVVEDMTIYPIKVLNGSSVIGSESMEAYPKSIHHYEASSWQDKKIIERMIRRDEELKKFYLGY